MKIAIASDHAGFDLKNELIEALKERQSKKVDEELIFEDFGTHDKSSTDYPTWGELVGEKVASKEFDRGLLVCGTGVGISLAANKVKGIRAVVCSDTYTAKMSREHNNSNVLSLGARVVGVGLAIDILNVWLDKKFEEGGRHQRRVDLISGIEDKNFK